MESRIISLFKVGFNITHSWNPKPQKKVFLFVLQDMKIFTPRKKKENILHKHSQNKDLFIWAVLFLCFISTQFAGFASLKNTNADYICKAI